MYLRTLCFFVSLMGLAAPFTLAADVYRVSGQGASATLHRNTYDRETGFYTNESVYIQVGEIDAAGPPEYRQSLLLASVHYYFDECDADWNCAFRSFLSGEVEIPPETVAFGRDTVMLEIILDLYESWEPADSIPIQISLVWNATGAQPFRRNSHYHNLSEYQISNGHYSSLTQDAHVSGIVIFEGNDLLNDAYMTYGSIEFARSGEIFIHRGPF